MHHTLSLESTIYTPSQMQLPDAPQLALAGRSNVGKSSLVNALAGRRTLAKTSSTPGKTRSINLYRVTPGDFYLADLPGYGYARASHADRDAWARLIHAYLTDNPHLRALVVLLDSRLAPQQLDMDLVAYAQEHHIPLLPVLTKADKTSLKERAQVARRWADILGRPEPPLAVSSRTGLGVAQLWQRLRRYALPEEAADNTLDAPK
ncbi:MAG: small GTP-binding protein [Desulfomicrobiaceae bacterium]|jgi:GTP-binding protein|nr:small GTP-binding protein [Desulfomicrobiaceae bacterium]MBZ4684911.1 small GTP-binding protein [Desulfomicrobiaceae bacterium]MDI3493507.1 GTP-binding protein [Desulfomicrobiaceae bacterium]MDK2873286.1 GTP-binding protein [Desulfomicrobiaceae bacterium]HCF06223.1 YihA family ribosome biogenesis GTP-binding protein [Desulfomicrobiaceae bacterium]